MDGLEEIRRAIESIDEMEWVLSNVTYKSVDDWNRIDSRIQYMRNKLEKLLREREAAFVR